MLDPVGHDDPRVPPNKNTRTTPTTLSRSRRQPRRAVCPAGGPSPAPWRSLYFGVLAANLAGTQQALVGLAVVIVVSALLGGAASNASIRRGPEFALAHPRVFRSSRCRADTPDLRLGGLYYARSSNQRDKRGTAFLLSGLRYRFWYAIVIIGMTPLMLGGMQTWLNKLNSWSLPVFLVGVTAAIIVAGWSSGWTSDWWSTGPDTSSQHAARMADHVHPVHGQLATRT